MTIFPKLVTGDNRQTNPVCCGKNPDISFLLRNQFDIIVLLTRVVHEAKIAKGEKSPSINWIKSSVLSLSLYLYIYIYIYIYIYNSMDGYLRPLVSCSLYTTISLFLPDDCHIKTAWNQWLQIRSMLLDICKN